MNIFVTGLRMKFWAFYGKGKGKAKQRKKIKQRFQKNTFRSEKEENPVQKKAQQKRAENESK